MEILNAFDYSFIVLESPSHMLNNSLFQFAWKPSKYTPKFLKVYHMPLYSLLVAFPTCVLMFKIVRMNECFDSVPKRDRDFKCVFPDARASNNLQFLLNNSITLMLQSTQGGFYKAENVKSSLYGLYIPRYI